MVMYINLHMALEQMRQKAEHSESDIGPRVSDYSIFLVVNTFTIHCTHYLSSHWLRAYS